jgi:hypothetical protein
MEVANGRVIQRNVDEHCAVAHALRSPCAPTASQTLRTMNMSVTRAMLRAARNRCASWPTPSKWTSIIFLCLMVLLQVVTSTQLSATTMDPLALLAARCTPPQIRWENVERWPAWLHGSVPRIRLRDGLHEVELNHGQRVCVELEAYGMLRAFQPAGELRVGDIEFWISNGSGLFQEATPVKSADEQSLVVAPALPYPCHIWIRSACSEQAPTSQSSRRLALFTSRIQPVAAPIPYDNLTNRFSTCQSLVWQDDRTERLARIEPGFEQSIEITGPAQLRIRSRRVVQAHDTASRQTYRIFVRSNCVGEIPLEFHDRVDLENPVTIEGIQLLLGTREESFVIIPSGQHRITFDSEAPTLVEVSQARTDNFLLMLNQPNVWRDESKLLAKLAESQSAFYAQPYWLSHENDIALLHTQLDESDGAIEPIWWQRALLRNMRNKSYLHSGLRSYQAVRRLQLINPEQLEWRETEQVIKYLGTRRLTLLPLEFNSERGMYFAWWVHADVGEVQPQLPQLLRLDEPLLDGHLHRLNGGTFNTISQEQASPTLFEIPPGLGETKLEVAVDLTSVMSPTRIFVQVDDRLPQQCEVHPQNATNSLHWPLRTRAVLESLNQLNESTSVATKSSSETARAVQSAWGQSTWGAAFALQKESGELVSAGTAEFDIPANASIVRIWSNAAPGTSPCVCLQVIDQREPEIAESSFVNLKNRLGDEASGILVAALVGDEPIDLPSNDSVDVNASLTEASIESLPEPSPLSPAIVSGSWIETLPQAELRNEYAPLAWSLQVSANEFAEGVVDQTLQPITGKLETADSQRTTLALAQELMENEQWLAALEQWRLIVPRLTGTERREAIQKMWQALDQVGSPLIMFQQLRAGFLFDDDELVRGMAEAWLAEKYMADEDFVSLARMRAYELLRDPNSETLHQYSAALILIGKHREALLIELALPEELQDLETVIRCAYRERWWQTFERCVAQLESPEDGHFWYALRAIAHRDLGKAVEEFRAAGLRGEPFLQAIQTGQSINQRILNAADSRVARDELELAISEWESWQSAHPGPYVWKSGDALVQSANASRTIKLIESEFIDQRLVATSSEPLHLRIAGPTKIRLRTFPLLPRENSARVEDWIHVQSDSWKVIHPLHARYTISSIVLQDDSGQGLGSMTEFEVDIPAGVHSVKVFAETNPLLVGVWEQSPEFPLGILPQLNVATLEAARGKTQVEFRAQGSSSHELLSFNASNSQSISELIGVWTRTPGREQPGDNSETPEGDHNESVRLGAKEMREDNAESEMTALVFAAEHDPATKEVALVRGSEIASQSPGNRLIQQLYDRLTRDAEWERVVAVQSSAGVHEHESSEWIIESPAGRVRRALTSEIDPTERLLASGERIILAMSSSEPVVFEFGLSLAKAANEPLEPVQVWYQTTGQVPQSVVIDPNVEQEQRIRLSLPKGRQHVKFWQAEDRFGHVVQIRQREIADWLPRGSAGALAFPPTTRQYHVASNDEPVKFVVAGPVWMRIDELKNGITLSRYVAIRQRQQLLELNSAEDSESSYFRIFLLKSTGEYDDLLPCRSTWVASPRLESPLAEFAIPPNRSNGPADQKMIALASNNQAIAPDSAGVLPDGNAPFYALDPNFAIGNQEDGTWSMSAGWTDRRPVEEGILAGADRFGEARLTHRYHNDFTKRYLRTELLGRARPEFGSSIGVRHFVRAYDDAETTSLEFDGAGYLQQPGAKLDATEGDTEWSIFGRGRVLHMQEFSERARRLFSASLQGRALSLQQNPYQAGQIDQDIFTTYKREHLWQMTIQETWMYQPTWDSRWRMTPQVVSNQDLNPLRPDHYGILVGFDQAVGPAECSLNYRLSRFLEDEDRASAYWQNLVSTQVLLDIPWGRRRSELGVMLNTDIDRKAVSAAITWTWYYDNGRWYRDLLPGEEVFEKWRLQRRHEY